MTPRGGSVRFRANPCPIPLNPVSAQPSAPNQRILRIWLLALAVNCAVFAIYRIIFLARFGPAVGSGGNLQVLWAGLRLDAALLGFEFSLTGIWLLVRRRVRPHRLWLWFWCVDGPSRVCLCGELFDVP